MTNDSLSVLLCNSRSFSTLFSLHVTLAILCGHGIFDEFFPLLFKNAACLKPYTGKYHVGVASKSPNVCHLKICGKCVAKDPHFISASGC